MQLAGVVAVSLIKMIILLLIGFIATKAGVLTEERCRGITELILKVLMPCLLISSFFGGYDKTKASNLLWALLLSVIAQLVSIAVSRLLVRKSDRSPNWRTDRGNSAWPNVGFLGVPLVASIYGSEGVLYAAMYTAIYNIVQWSYGEADMSGDFSPRGVLRSVTSPIMIASFAGFLIYFLRINVPDLIAAPITSLGNCCTSIPMVIIGSSLARCDLRSVVRLGRTYLMLAVKLLIIPAVFMIVLKFFDVPEIVKVAMLIPAACPPSTGTTMLCLRYGYDDSYSAAQVGYATLVSIVTIPLIMLLYSVI